MTEHTKKPLPDPAKLRAQAQAYRERAEALVPFSGTYISDHAFLPGKTIRDIHFGCLSEGLYLVFTDGTYTMITYHQDRDGDIAIQLGESRPTPYELQAAGLTKPGQLSQYNHLVEAAQALEKQAKLIETFLQQYREFNLEEEDAE